VYVCMTPLVMTVMIHYTTVIIKFVDNADADGAYVERWNALSAHPSTESHSGNSMIFSAEVYKHCEGFSDRHVLLDTCAGESVVKN
jgi:hypothetical protein